MVVKRIVEEEEIKLNPIRILRKLIILLVNKGIITAAEAKNLKE